MTLSLIHYSHLSSDDLRSCWPSDSIASDVSMLAAIEHTCRRNWAMPLRGVDNFLFDRSRVTERFKNHVPVADFDADFDLTWSDIADSLAVELIARAKKNNKKIMLSWSGGVDSTVILIALLKHLDHRDRDLLTVSLTRSSIIEASQIYFKYLHGRYDIVDFDVFADNFDFEEYQKYIHVCGDPADQLCVSVTNSTRVLLEDFSWSQKSFKNTAEFHKLLTYTFDQPIAEWLGPKLVENLQSVDVPIKSCYQALWWFAFNHIFLGSLCATWCHTWWAKGLTMDQWLDNQFLWFSDPRYQKWALKHCDRYDVLFGPNIDQWKWMSKQYITDYTNDTFWLKYKTKMSSNNRRTQKSNPKWVALSGNRLLTLENDLEELQISLPQCLHRS